MGTSRIEIKGKRKQFLDFAMKEYDAERQSAERQSAENENVYDDADFGDDDGYHYDWQAELDMADDREEDYDYSYDPYWSDYDYPYYDRL